MRQLALIGFIGLLASCGGKQTTGGGGGATAQLSVKKVTLGTGVELEYAERGSPDGKPVVFLHGVYDSRHSFDRLLPLLPGNYHIFVIDLRGHGNSSKPDTGFAQSDFAGDVIAFLDAVKLDRVNLVGHSMGALIAHKIAIEHPERVDKLVLMAATPTLANKPGAAEAQKMLATLTDPIDVNFVREFVKGSFVKQPPDDFLQAQVAESMKIPAKVWKQVLGAAIAEDHSKDLSKIKAKTLLLWGDQDPLFDRNDQKVLDDAIPDSTLTIFPGVGHNVPSEEPEKAASAIDAFLR